MKTYNSFLEKWKLVSIMWMFVIWGEFYLCCGCFSRYSSKLASEKIFCLSYMACLGKCNTADVSVFNTKHLIEIKFDFQFKKMFLILVRLSSHFHHCTQDLILIHSVLELQVVLTRYGCPNENFLSISCTNFWKERCWWFWESRYMIISFSPELLG